MKICSTCLIPKPLEAFNNRKRYAFGKDSVCRDCTNIAREAGRREHGILPRRTFLERIWGDIAQCGHGPTCPYCCWPWTSPSAVNGYGRITLKVNGQHTAHFVTHIVYELWHARPVPLHAVIAHHCDNPPCCNPDHLWLATRQENVDDCKRKGRTAIGARNGKATHPEATPRGEQHGRAVLTDTMVLDMRNLYASGISMHKLSKQFGVSVPHVSRIIHRKNRSNI